MQNNWLNFLWIFECSVNIVHRSAFLTLSILVILLTTAQANPFRLKSISLRSAILWVFNLWKKYVKIDSE